MTFAPSPASLMGAILSCHSYEYFLAFCGDKHLTRTFELLVGDPSHFTICVDNPILYHWFLFSTTAVCCICLCPDIKIKQSYTRRRKWTIMNLLTWLLTFKYLECFQTAHHPHFCICIHQLSAYSHFRNWNQPSSDCFWQYLQLSSEASLTSTPTWGNAWPGLWRWENFFLVGNTFCAVIRPAVSHILEAIWTRGFFF